MSRVVFDYSEMRMTLLREIQAAWSEDAKSPSNARLSKSIYSSQTAMLKHLKWLIDEGFVRSEGLSSGRKLRVTDTGKAASQRGTFDAPQVTEPIVDAKPEAPDSDVAARQTDKEDAVLGLFRKLENVGTEELVKELARREGIRLIRTKQDQQYKITGDSSRIKETGKATILLIRGA